MLHVYLFNKLLHTTTTQDKRKILLKYIKNYPNWLDRADREILVEENFGFEMFCDREDYIGQTLICRDLTPAVRKLTLEQ